MAKRHSKELKDEVVSLFRQGKTKSEIAKQFDIPICSVSYIISSYLMTPAAAQDSSAVADSFDNLEEAVSIAWRCSLYGFESEESASLIAQLGCSKEEVQRLYQWYRTEAKLVPVVTFQQLNAQVLNLTNQLRSANTDIANLKQSYQAALLDSEEAKARAKVTEQLKKEVEALKEVVQCQKNVLSKRSEDG